MAGRGLGLGEKSCKEDRTLPALEPGAAEGTKGHFSCQGWAAWGERSFIVQLSSVFHLGGRKRLCGEGSWCSSQREAEAEERFAGEVEGRRGGRERLAPGSRTRIRVKSHNPGFDLEAAVGFVKWEEFQDL